ncbi:MAG TPA: helix-turn-helix domain-containing protein [Labilithrix sp.]|jgi:DNA-binding NtrC family response regulator|nr:helix-turn-helix domain-containing protein [Labilithrix sp.]
MTFDGPGHARRSGLLALAEPGEELGPDLVDRLENSATPDAAASPLASGTLHEQVAAFEAALVARPLALTNHNQSEAARRLGISRMTLIEKMKRHGLR